MKKYKKLSLLLVLFVIASLFTGCNQEEKTLAEAFIKSQDMLSMESASNIEFDLKVKGFDEETQIILDEMVNQVNDMKLSVNQQSITNKDQTLAKAQIDANVQLTDMNFDTSVWVDMGMSDGKLILKEIFKLPSMLMNSIPGATDKEYIILDFDTLNESISNMEEDMPETMDFDKIMAIAMKYQEKFTDALMTYIKNYNTELSLITPLDDQVVDGEKIQYYQIEFDNDSFKDFLRHSVISILQDENILPLFQDYMEELISMSGEKMPEELSFTDSIGEMVQKTRDFFEMIDELTVLGEDGILITLGINEDGFFVSEAGNMNFLIDTKEIIDLFAHSVDENELLEQVSAPVVELSISYDTTINNINEDLEITMPTITKENSVDYMKLIESLIPEIPQNQELMVIVEDEFITFTNPPILIDNHYLVPSTDIIKPLQADIAWNEDTKEITITKDELLFTINEAVIIDNVSYIPLRTVAENLDYQFEWDENAQLFFIHK